MEGVTYILDIVSAFLHLNSLTVCMRTVLEIAQILPKVYVMSLQVNVIAFSLGLELLVPVLMLLVLIIALELENVTKLKESVSVLLKTTTKIVVQGFVKIIALVEEFVTTILVFVHAIQIMVD